MIVCFNWIKIKNRIVGFQIKMVSAKIFDFTQRIKRFKINYLLSNLIKLKRNNFANILKN